MSRERILFHKLKVVLKGIERIVGPLKIIYRAKLFKSGLKLKDVLREKDKLISIFVRSVERAQKNQKADHISL